MMTAKKYVNAVGRRLKCTKEKREEIKQQLLKDISTATNGGAALESVIQRMGSADAVADKFNRKFSESEIKKYKKNRRIRILCESAAVIILLSVLMYQMTPKTAEIGSSGLFEEQAVEEALKEIIEAFRTGDLEILHKWSSEDMQEVMTSEKLKEAKNQMSDEYGEWISFGEPDMFEMKKKGETYAMAQIAASYEKNSITYMIAFDQDMKIAGFYMK